MECNFKDIFTLVLIIIIVFCIYKSYADLRKLNYRESYRPNVPITGGSILDTVKPEEVASTLEDYKSINNLGKLNFNFPARKDEAMELTKSVVSKK
jgi:hypothetical protein